MKRFAVVSLAVLVAVFALGVWTGRASSGADHGTFLGLPVVALELNGEILQVPVGDTPAVLLGGRTMVPLRFVSERLGAEVAWDNSTSMAIVKTKPTGATGLSEPVQMGVSLVIDELTADLESVTYALDTNWPTLKVNLTNTGERFVRIDPTTMYLACVLSDAAHQAEFDAQGTSISLTGPEPGLSGDLLLPGQSVTVSFVYRCFWPDTTITQATLHCSFMNATGTIEQVEVGTWIIP
jgi:archaellum component FlaF (FlaF/FlaG flagellin family)